jgi:hypothetical protein
MLIIKILATIAAFIIIVAAERSYNLAVEVFELLGCFRKPTTTTK